jgi:hypothetical protein
MEDYRRRSAALVRDYLAVIGQRARADQLDIAAEFRHRAQRRGQFIAQDFPLRRAFRLQRHHVGLAGARDDEAEPTETGMALADLGDLLWANEHALDLGGLVGAAHPALDAQVARPQGLIPGSAAVRSPSASRTQG